MRIGFLCLVAAAVPVASAAASTDTSFKLSAEAWQRRCDLIMTAEALEARGIYMNAVKATAVTARYDTDPDGGTVVLDLRITGNGRVKDQQLVSTTSGALVGPVMRSVAGWRYKPVEIDGVEVCVEMRLTMPITPNPYSKNSQAWGGTLQRRSKDYSNPPPPPGSMPPAR